MALRQALRDPGGHIGPGELRQRLGKLPRSGFVQQAGWFRAPEGTRPKHRQIRDQPLIRYNAPTNAPWRALAVMIHQENFSFKTTGHRHMADLTEQVAAVVGRSEIKAGIVQVFCVGSTAAVGTIEFEPGLQRDLPEVLDRLIPPSRDYGHELAWHDGNGHSHLQATLLGPSLSVPVTDGKPVLGTWQQIMHLECDVRPRQRTVVVTVMGE
jgi:secondary thiamine-phosphate synthase enzyme